MDKQKFIETILRKNAEYKESYKLKFSGSPISVSRMIELSHAPFDSQAIAQKTYDKNFNNPDSKYYQMTVEQILESWQTKAATSCSYGSHLDNYIGFVLEEKDENEFELWKMDNNYEWDERLNGICTGFDQFYSYLKENSDYEFVCREIPIWFVKGDMYAQGRLDALFYSPSKNKYLVIDWKNTEKIDTSNKWGKLYGPLNQLDDCNGNHYTLQTQFYRTSLATSYPELGINEDDISTLVVQMLPEANDKGVHYNTYKENTPYNRVLIERFIDFAIKKNKLMSK